MGCQLLRGLREEQSGGGPARAKALGQLLCIRGPGVGLKGRERRGSLKLVLALCASQGDHTPPPQTWVSLMSSSINS